MGSNDAVMLRIVAPLYLYWTLRVTVVECDNVPEVPVMVIV